MGMEMVCDVFRTAKDVKEYRIEVYETGNDGLIAGDHERLLNVYLCPKGLDRLTAKIEAGCKPPAARKKASDESEAPE